LCIDLGVGKGLGRIAVAQKRHRPCPSTERPAFGVAAISAVATAAAAVAVAGTVIAIIAMLATPTVRTGAEPQVPDG
jgi:hypothetical protein